MSIQLTRRDFTLRAAAFGLALGLTDHPLAQSQQPSPSATPPPAADPYALVDPELLPPLKQFPAYELTAEMVAKFRQIPSMAPSPAPAPQPIERRIPGSPGAPDVRLWIVDPAPSETSKPVLLYLHGGGFMMPDPMLQPHLQAIATECHCVVVSVDYRLAPETRYPGSLEDNYAALKWVHAHAAELGVDATRIAVGGDSAGGNVAAVVCHDLLKAGGPMPRFQLLIYPATDLSCSAASHKLFARGFLLEASTIRFYIDQYIRTPADIDDPRASPLKSASFVGLPPAMVITAGFDPLRDEGRAYADALAAAGVEVTYRNDAGMVHGYFAMCGAVDVAKDAMGEAVRELADALGA